MKTWKLGKAIAGTCLAFALTANLAVAETTIRVAYAAGPVKNLYEGLARRFMDTHPDIKVVLDPPAVDYDDLIQRTLRQRITNQLPDVSHQGLNQIKALAERGISVPLDDFIAKDPTWKNIGVPDSVTSFASYAGKTQALPFAISGPVLFYNADLVKKAGGDPDNLPRDWDGILALGKKIDALGHGVHGLYVEYTNNSWSFQTLVGSFGGRMMSADERQIEFAGPAGMQAMTLLRRITLEGQQPAFGRDQARASFQSGTLGILFTASSALNSFEQSAAGKFRFVVGPIPVSSPNDRLPSGGNAIVMLTRDAAKQKAAWEYIKFAIGIQSQTEMAKATGYEPVNVAAMKDENGLAKFIKEHPNYSVAASRMPMMTGWFSFPGENNSRIIKAIEDNCYAVVMLKLQPEEALANMKKDVQALLPH
ncbi:ABC transporter substrate-binding protein [Paraburkholderia phenoliruptrix]|uniref:ABC transporter substrate-binding protein n=1 Tax=Paraburkholderia phenoliruptrix TaxID=252970 RepID=UPI002869904C|nr:ABC transporter substrate-binding protein [Paraburkholderia phenoliruptrix]WMY10996.1 ABC transporter substrate-binding protein [Paraburkholderia phenoliruptrix]